MIRTLLLATLLPFIPIRAVDGDTLDGLAQLRPGLFENWRVRLDCYSAPELRADGGGVVETKRLERWLAQDGGYWLRTDWKRDKYGRLLGEPVHADAGYCR